jgi:hypothetical protein
MLRVGRNFLLLAADEKDPIKDDNQEKQLKWIATYFAQCRNRGLVNIHIVQEVLKQVQCLPLGDRRTSTTANRQDNVRAVLNAILNERLTPPLIDLSSSGSKTAVDLKAKDILDVLPNAWTKTATEQHIHHTNSKSS